MAALLLHVVAIATLTGTPCYRPPVDGSVVDPFRPPGCTWCAGNRGIDYDVPPRTWVHALADGTVTFAGAVAGKRWVVVAHDDGLRSSYGVLDTVLVRAGDRVSAGRVVGTTDHDLHLGLRDGDTYLDPSTFVARPVARARLVPTDGTAARPGPAAQLRCATGSIGR